MLPVNPMMAAIPFEQLDEERMNALQARAQAPNPNNMQHDLAALGNIDGRLNAQPQPLGWIALTVLLRSIKFVA